MFRANVLKWPLLVVCAYSPLELTRYIMMAKPQGGFPWAFEVGWIWFWLVVLAGVMIMNHSYQGDQGHYQDHRCIKFH